MAGLLAMAAASAGEQNWLFVHTGGTPALFAYENELTSALSEQG